MKRVLQYCTLVVLIVATASCSGTGRLKGEAAVYLTAEITSYGPDIDICGSTADVTIDSLIIESHLKNTTAANTSAQDVRLTRWVVTPYRTDGGTLASPEWVNDLDAYVPAGGIANLSDYRVFPAEYFLEPPLSYLLPENGGFDPETGYRNIRQGLQIQVFGTTNNGKEVSVTFTADFNFFCNS
jgi:hypothetical protein